MKKYRFCSYHKNHKIDHAVQQLRNKRIYMRDWGRMGSYYADHLRPQNSFSILVATVAYTHDGTIIGACISDVSIDREGTSIEEVFVTYNTYVRKPYRNRGVGSHLAKLCYQKSCQFHPHVERTHHTAECTDYISPQFWGRQNIDAVA